MLDHRYETFLALCRIRNYTKTAELLSMTQPGVTQHIQYLERTCGGKLFTYRDRTLTLTARGQKLLDFVTRLKADSIHAMDILRNDRILSPVHFGATLTIGEYLMPQLIKRMHDESPDILLSMQVGNTITLLEKLRRGEIQFALLEGFFDSSVYDSMCLKSEKFIAVCASKSPLAKAPVSLDRLLESKLILRERGSGTREVLEHTLMRYNLTANSFDGIMEIGNMSAIKQLVAEDVGISFMYFAAAAQEILRNELSQIRITNLDTAHNFSFVTLKNSIHRAEYTEYFERFQQLCLTIA